jgi:hypothetical protein
MGKIRCEVIANTLATLAKSFISINSRHTSLKVLQPGPPTRQSAVIESGQTKISFNTTFLVIEDATAVIVDLHL